MQLIAACQRGEPFLGFPTVAGCNLCYVSVDRPFDSSALYWAEKAGVNPTKLNIYDLVTGPNVDLDSLETRPVAFLTSFINKLPPTDLLIIDTIGFYVGDIMNYAAISGRLRRLTKLARAHNMTIVGTHHASKRRSDFSFKRAQDNILGSTALLGSSDTQIFLNSGIETDEPFDTLTINPHTAPQSSIQLKRNDLGLFNICGMDLDEDARILAMLRADVWTPVSLLITVLDKVPERTLRRRLHDLVEEGLVERRGHTNTTEYRLSTSANPA
jgi:hypothetical protein